jgi:hypothetical protein
MAGTLAAQRLCPRTSACGGGYSSPMIDRKIASKIELLVQGMRSVIAQLSPDERKLVISSIRARSGDDVADRLEAPSGRNH